MRARSFETREKAQRLGMQEGQPLPQPRPTREARLKSVPRLGETEPEDLRALNRLVAELRRNECEWNRIREGERPSLIEDLKNGLATINGSPKLLARARKVFIPAKKDAHFPFTVDGMTPPDVQLTALWLRPDSAFAYVEPRPRKRPSPEDRNKLRQERERRSRVLEGLAHDVGQLKASVLRIQRHEKASKGMSLSPQIHEAQKLINKINAYLYDGDLGRENLRRALTVRPNVGSIWKSNPRAMLYTFIWLDSTTTPSRLELVLGPDSKKLAPELQTTSTPDASQKAASAVSESKEQAISPTEPQRARRSTQDQEDDADEMPISIPYTTAASDFLYGSNTVLAALRAHRRKLYHLYLHPRLYSRESNATAIAELAKTLQVRTTTNAELRLLDKMSDNRPHNGVVLECSRLPAPPLLALAIPDLRTAITPLHLARQSSEDIAVNGAPGAFPTLTQTWRHPLVLMLDGVVDPGNVGNILRTAHFYGVDAVCVAVNTCAPLKSAALAKASSGACEALRIFALPRPADFVANSKKAGWRVYAAVAPSVDERPTEIWSMKDRERNSTTSSVARSSPLAKHPIILMLGAEGEGLRENLRNKADGFVTIEQGQRAVDNGEEADVCVDSLNVGVAAGVLVEAFMRRPKGAKDLAFVGDLGF